MLLPVIVCTDTTCVVRKMPVGSQYRTGQSEPLALENSVFPTVLFARKNWLFLKNVKARVHGVIGGSALNG